MTPAVLALLSLLPIVVVAVPAVRRGVDDDAVTGGRVSAVAGSNTVSNMMFSLFQFAMRQRMLVDPTWIVALQAVGGAAGNMICVHNVVAASAVVGLFGREGIVIRMTVVPFVYYALLPGSIGYIIVSYARTGMFNIGALLVTLIAAGAVYLVVRYNRAVPRPAEVVR